MRPSFGGAAGGAGGAGVAGGTGGAGATWGAGGAASGGGVSVPAGEVRAAPAAGGMEVEGGAQEQGAAGVSEAVQSGQVGLAGEAVEGMAGERAEEKEQQKEQGAGVEVGEGALVGAAGVGDMQGQEAAAATEGEGAGGEGATGAGESAALVPGEGPTGEGASGEGTGGDSTGAEAEGEGEGMGAGDTAGEGLQQQEEGLQQQEEGGLGEYGGAAAGATGGAAAEVGGGAPTPTPEGTPAAAPEGAPDVSPWDTSAAVPAAPASTGAATTATADSTAGAPGAAGTAGTAGGAAAVEGAATQQPGTEVGTAGAATAGTGTAGAATAETATVGMASRPRRSTAGLRGRAAAVAAATAGRGGGRGEAREGGGAGEGEAAQRAAARQARFGAATSPRRGRAAVYLTLLLPCVPRLVPRASLVRAACSTADAVFSGVVAFILIFRTNLSYALEMGRRSNPGRFMDIPPEPPVDADQVEEWNRVRGNKSLVFLRAHRPHLEKYWRALPLAVLGGVNLTECSILEPSRDRVYLVMCWLHRALVARRMAGGISQDAPIVSRIYQVLSDGMLGYENALKIVNTPFPFPFAQCVALLLHINALVIPLLMADWLADPLLASAITLLSVFSFYLLNEVAREIEEPFRFDPNDLPVVYLHHKFNERLVTAFSRSVFPADGLFTHIDEKEMAWLLAKHRPVTVVKGAEEKVGVLDTKDCVIDVLAAWCFTFEPPPAALPAAPLEALLLLL
ncbi:unnamed protein product [Closterium sp. Naga37s-1]|nr:unnamed protein product [Closterium sp. Naga37s-1]